MNGLYEITHEFKLASLLAGIRGTFVCLVEKWPKFCPFPSLSLSLVRVEFQYYVLGSFVKTNLNFGNLHQNLSLWSLPNGTYHDNNDILLGTFSRKAPFPYWLFLFYLHSILCSFLIATKYLLILMCSSFVDRECTLVILYFFFKTQSKLPPSGKFWNQLAMEF